MGAVETVGGSFGYVPIDDKAEQRGHTSVLIIPRACLARRHTVVAEDGEPLYCLKFKDYRFVGINTASMKLSHIKEEGKRTVLCARQANFSRETRVTTQDKEDIATMKHDFMRANNSFKLGTRSYRWTVHSWSFPFRQELIDIGNGRTVATLQRLGLFTRGACLKAWSTGYRSVCAATAGDRGSPGSYS
ncbi:hypothetical protein WJX73_005865 [Symbiochloris irregularis]|uniref:Uncharacterized protein n=1 Tax=Symbiochloris irregularis TaxID=706552 RepID=A0AAW1P753_9CHLO